MEYTVELYNKDDDAFERCQPLKMVDIPTSLLSWERCLVVF